MDTAAQHQHDVLDALPTLSPDVLRAVHDRCVALLVVGGARLRASIPAGNDDFAADLYTALTAELRARTQVNGPPYHVFRRLAQHKHFAECAQAAAAANAQWFPQQTRAERLSMLRLYARLVLDYVQEQHRPAVWPVIGAACAALPAVVDRAFPGYAESGLLGKVQALRTRKRGS